MHPEVEDTGRESPLPLAGETLVVVRRRRALDEHEGGVDEADERGRECGALVRRGSAGEQRLDRGPVVESPEEVERARIEDGLGAREPVATDGTAAIPGDDERPRATQPRLRRCGVHRQPA